ncbi:MAG: DUF4432 family protein [Marinosulfonomonas sp.]|nr:DUF4432 family protein [Marinosulfonomonas sp.]
MSTTIGHDLTQGQLADLLGDPTQIAGIRQMRFDSGPEAGTRLIQIRNATGLCVELLPDRCLDIGQVWQNGYPFAWMGPNGLPTWREGLTMEDALGGLMATCGFDHIRQPVTHDGHAYPLHGTMALKPAGDVSVRQTGSGPDAMFVAQAEVVQASPNGATYRLNRRISVPIAQNTILLEDVITVTPHAPILALYHINLGFPLISPSTQVSCNGTPRNDMLEGDPQTRIHGPLSGPNIVRVADGLPGSDSAIEISTDSKNLPWLQTHRRAEPGSNLFCVEPVTHDRKPRAELLQNGEDQDQERREFAIKFALNA